MSLLKVIIIEVLHHRRPVFSRAVELIRTFSEKDHAGVLSVYLINPAPPNRSILALHLPVTSRT